ncbi:MAG: right-handed parallel beta-helix repeat-containing protein, partial [Kiritimatiellaeota bacterium]|nr:right-handed parallel beta-helix repeat-containing protein [Kiritimatiellota bacterium]
MYIHTKIRQMAVAFIAAVLAGITAQAVNYYVATPADGGSDTNSGSFASPFATINKGIDTAADNDYADYVIVMPGVYGPIRSPNKKITIQSYSGDPNDTIIDGHFLGNNQSWRCATLFLGDPGETTGTGNIVNGMLGPGILRATPESNFRNNMTNTVVRGFMMRNGKVGAAYTPRPREIAAETGARWQGGTGTWPAGTTPPNVNGLSWGNVWGGGGVRGGTVIDCIISNNVAATGSGYGGGAVFSRLHNTVITHNSRADNWAGGAYGCFLFDCTIKRNHSFNQGGGLDDCPVAINCLIEENTAEGIGAGIYVFWVCGLYEGCVIRNNGDGNSWGGGFGINSGNSTTTAANRRGQVRRCTIEGNIGSTGGGIGMNVGDAYWDFTDCIIRNNHATSGNGGGAVWATDGASNNAGDNQSVRVFNSVIYGNTCASGASVAYNGFLYNCEIYSNRTLQATGNADTILSGGLWNCLVYENYVTASSGTYSAGGARDSNNGSAGVRNSVFWNNVNGSIGNNNRSGGIINSPTYNAIVWTNSMDNGVTLSDRSVSYSGTWAFDLFGLNAGPTTGSNHILGQDPVFWDTTLRKNFRLRSRSPAIFTASPTVGTAAGSHIHYGNNKDIEGKARPQSGKATMGAYEVKWEYECFAGYDEEEPTPDDIMVIPSITFYDLNNYVFTVDSGHQIQHRDTEAFRLFDDGNATVAVGSLIFDPRTIVRQGTAANPPEMTIAKTVAAQDTQDAFIVIYSGNTWDLDGDRRPPTGIMTDGIYDQYVGIFTPDNPSQPIAFLAPGIIDDTANHRVILPGEDNCLYNADDVIVNGASVLADADLISGIVTLKPGMTVDYPNGLHYTVINSSHYDLEACELPSHTLITPNGTLIIPPEDSDFFPTDDNLIWQAGNTANFYSPDKRLDHDSLIDIPAGTIIDLPTDNYPPVQYGVFGEFDVIDGIFRPRDFYDGGVDYTSAIDNHPWAVFPGIRFNPAEVADIVPSESMHSGLVVAGPSGILYSKDDILIRGATVDGLDVRSGTIYTPATDVVTETYTYFYPEDSDMRTESVATVIAEGQGGAVFNFRHDPHAPTAANFLEMVIMTGYNTVAGENPTNSVPAALDFYVYAGNRIVERKGMSGAWEIDEVVPAIGSVNGPYEFLADAFSTGDPDPDKGKIVTAEAGFEAFTPRVMAPIATHIVTTTGDTLTGKEVDKDGEVVPGATLQATNAGENPAAWTGMYFGGHDWVPGFTTAAVDGANTVSGVVKVPRYGQDDDIFLGASIKASDIDAWGAYSPASSGAASVIVHRDGSALEGGAMVAGDWIISPDVIIRQGSGTITDDGRYLQLTAGTTIDVDGDGIAAFTLPAPGSFDKLTGAFQPSIAHWHHTVGTDGGYMTHYLADGSADGWMLKADADSGEVTIVSAPQATLKNTAPAGASIDLPLDDMILNSEMNAVYDLTAIMDATVAGNAPFNTMETRITTMRVPDTLEYLGDYAFNNFDRFNDEDFVMPADLTHI